MAKKGSARKSSHARRKPGRETQVAPARAASLTKHGSHSHSSPRTRKAARTSQRTDTRASAQTKTTSLPENFPNTRYIFFGGKGGTGKTTAAAATALMLLDAAREGEQILLFSTDPAHSLSDSFDEQVGELKHGVAGLQNLDAKEIDPAARFEELKDRK